MPKTLTGAELQLDDGPARDSELFLVDGNNLAYRAFFALPEELATTEGFPTNALLGFTNMLFKLLPDYRPKGVAVAWDTRPVERLEQFESYKSERRPTPDLLREQFPYFRPIVEAFGYRNLEFEGWEADDVIATLATRADEAGIKTTVVSTDRDAFQLVTDNVTLMMTPRGVADVNVYTPDRVEARYGIRPDQIPDFIGLKGDTSRQHPGHPRHRRQDRRPADRAVRLARGGRRARGRADARTAEEHHRARGPGAHLEAARDDAARPRARFGRPRRARPRAARPLAAEGDVPAVRVPQPARPRRRARRGRARAADDATRGDGSRVARGRAPRDDAAASRSPSTTAASRSRRATASCVGAFDPAVAQARLRDAQVVAHDFKSLPRLTMTPAEDTMLAAYLIDPGRPAYEIDDLARGVRGRAAPGAGDRRGDGGARAPRRGARGAWRRCSASGCASAAASTSTATIELPLDGRARVDGGRRHQDRHVPHGRDHRAARRPRRGARGARAGARGRGVHARLDAAGGAGSSSRSSGSRPGRKGKTGYSTDTRVLRSIRARARDRRRDRGVARVLEAAQHVPRAASVAHLARGRPAAHDTSTRRSRRRAGSRRRTRTCRRSRSAPSSGARSARAFVAEPGHRLVSADYSQVELRILAHVSGEPKLRESFARGEDIHTATAAEVLGKDPATLTKDERNIAKMVNFGIIYGISSFGLSENLEIPRERGAGVHRRVPRALPATCRTSSQRTIEQAERDGYVTTLFGRRRPVPEIRASNRQTRVARRAARGQLGHAGHGGGHHQGRDGRDPPAAARGRPRVAARAAGARRAPVEAPEREVAAVKELFGPRWSARIALDPPLAVDVGAATTGTKPSPNRTLASRSASGAWHNRRVGIRSSPPRPDRPGRKRGERSQLAVTRSRALHRDGRHRRGGGRSGRQCGADRTVLLRVHRGVEQQQGTRDLQRHRSAVNLGTGGYNVQMFFNGGTTAA